MKVSPTTGSSPATQVPNTSPDLIDQTAQVTHHSIQDVGSERNVENADVLTRPKETRDFTSQHDAPSTSSVSSQQAVPPAHHLTPVPTNEPDMNRNANSSSVNSKVVIIPVPEHVSDHPTAGPTMTKITHAEAVPKGSSIVHLNKSPPPPQDEVELIDLEKQRSISKQRPPAPVLPNVVLHTIAENIRNVKIDFHKEQQEIHLK